MADEDEEMMVTPTATTSDDDDDDEGGSGSGSEDEDGGDGDGDGARRRRRHRRRHCMSSGSARSGSRSSGGAGWGGGGAGGWGDGGGNGGGDDDGGGGPVEEFPPDDAEAGDTTYDDAALGDDLQGIPWQRLQVAREVYRAQRVAQYRNYANVIGDAPDECARVRAELTAGWPQPARLPRGAWPYGFVRNWRAAASSIVHFQLRHLLHARAAHDVLLVHDNRVQRFDALARRVADVLDLRGLPKGPRLPGLGRVQVSTLAARGDLVAAGGFCGEVVLARIRDGGGGGGGWDDGGGGEWDAAAGGNDDDDDVDADDGALDGADDAAGEAWRANEERQLRQLQAALAARVRGDVLPRTAAVFARSSRPSPPPPRSPRSPSTATTTTAMMAVDSGGGSVEEQQQQQRHQQDDGGGPIASDDEGPWSAAELQALLQPLAGGPQQQHQQEHLAAAAAKRVASRLLEVRRAREAYRARQRRRERRAQQRQLRQRCGGDSDDGGGGDGGGGGGARLLGTTQPHGAAEVLHCLRVTQSENGITNALELVDSPALGGRCVLSSNNDCAVRVFDVATGRPRQRLSFPFAVNYATLRPWGPGGAPGAGSLVAVVGDDPDALLVDVRSGRTALRLRGHRDYAFAAAWHPRGHVLATGNQDSTTRLWDVRGCSGGCGGLLSGSGGNGGGGAGGGGGGPLAVLGGAMGAVRSLRFSPGGGAFLAAAEPADFVHIYDARATSSSGASGCFAPPRAEQQLDLFGEVAGVSFSPDGAALFVAVSDSLYSSLVQLQLNGPGDLAAAAAAAEGLLA